MKGLTIRIQGTVQGVGFRPWVWQLARRLGLGGSVCNDARGVLIEIRGEHGKLDRFMVQLEQEAPPLARIESIECTPLDNAENIPDDFIIAPSRGGEIHTGVASDAATCPECLSEIFNPDDRRYAYPFTNCTHCGPRLSIVREIPYDRANTSMAAFPMCPRCQVEYEDPSDRRFHAQPNACPDCGPTIWLEDAQGNFLEIERDKVIPKAAELIREGRILAIKGIGGIHLACDAANEAAVAELRRRKRRYDKALALMARDLGMISRFAKIDEITAATLSTAAAPIVILDARGDTLAPGINPGQNSLGFMLPYTPLHHLLMALLEDPIVLTSGNLSDAPQCISNAEAREKLGGIADFILLHDRDIVTRLDDSVVRLSAGQPRTLRRARGYAPEPISLPPGFNGPRKVLAMGAELKNTFCMLGEGSAVLSQHLGDLEDALVLREYQRMLEHYQHLYEFKPDLIVVDKHPNYLSSQLGRRLAQEMGLPLIEAQHHHAHMTACMAEHQLPADTEPALGLILDGLGYGEDGALWGGEFLLGNYRAYQRIAAFAPVPMPGGAMAMREPWRNTFAHLCAALNWEQVEADFSDLELIRFLKNKPLANLHTMLEKGINSPPASSAGRLFDGVAAALNLCRDQVSFEGQAAMLLEALAENAGPVPEHYRLLLKENRVEWSVLWEGILHDLKDGTDGAVIAARFHQGLSNGLANIAAELCHRHQVETLVLGGGVFQNRLLLEGLTAQLGAKGLQVLIPEKVPANDGGISLGQGAIGLYC
ncbi:MAG: carbamoyltransferase HypF [Candidatus Polarisedimenticolaceae bacterium]|nr:carbamoyltransferase HypF [Candidatus Polarisedimenticolaceae bacterium]